MRKCGLQYWTLSLLVAGCTLGGSEDPPADDPPDFEIPPDLPVDCEGGPTDELPATGVGRLTGYSISGFTDGDRSCAQFDDPVNVKLNSNGDLIVSDYNNHALRLITPDGITVTFSDQEGFFRPFGVAILADDTVIAQTDWNTQGAATPDNGAMWRVTPGGEATLIAEDTGRLRGLVPLPDGRIFATDYLNHYVGIFNPTTGAFAPLAGQRGESGNVEGTGTAARFFTPYDAVALPNGNMLVADFDNHCLREVTLTGVVTTYSGLCGTAGDATGTLAAARYNRPQGLAIDDAGVIYLTDIDNYVIKRIENGQVTTLAGTGVAGFADGPPLEAQFFGLEGIDVTPDGSVLYITDGDRGTADQFHRIRQITLGEVAANDDGEPEIE